MGRYLGIDFGKKRIGVAVSDEAGQISFPLCVIRNSASAQVIREISRIASEKNVTGIVVGLPLNLDGSRGPAAEMVEQFATLLNEKTGLPVDLWDERLSTRMAERAMIDGGLSRTRRRQSIDQSTAQIILQSFLDACAVKM
jgi:putative Holliday junction resolvase